MPLNRHLPGNCCTWNVIASHRRSPDFSTQPSCCNRPSVILSTSNFINPIYTQACNVNEAPVRIVLPFKDERSANSKQRQLGELGRKIGMDIRPVYVSRKIRHKIKPKEKKRPIINQQHVVYYKCGLCDANYASYTCRHLYQRVEEHKGSSSIGDHIREQHGTVPSDMYRDFKILRKCQSKFDCLIYEMLFIKELKPT